MKRRKKCNNEKMVSPEESMKGAKVKLKADGQIEYRFSEYIKIKSFVA